MASPQPYKGDVVTARQPEILAQILLRTRPAPWPNACRAMSNFALRSALFSINQTREIAGTRQLICASRGFEVWFKGERLNQHDLDLWEFLLHRARSLPLNMPVVFNGNQVLTELGRSRGRNAYDDLKKDIARLVAAYVEITSDSGVKFFGTLLNSGIRDNVTQYYAVLFNSKIYNLFQPSDFTLIDFDQRKKLGNNQLAKWLHGFYSSHTPSSPFLYKVETIRSLCGAKIAAAESPRLSKTVTESEPRLCDFRKLLRRALTTLQDLNVITSWEIDERDCVVVCRKATASQQRNMAKKAALLAGR